MAYSFGAFFQGWLVSCPVVLIDDVLIVILLLYITCIWICCIAGILYIG